MNAFNRLIALRGSTLAGCLLLGLALSASPAWAQQGHRSTEVAAEELVKALRAKTPDEGRLAMLLGVNWRDYIPVDSVGRENVDAFLARYDERHEIKPDAQGRMMLTVGNDPWTLPIPLVKRGGGGWFFDLEAAATELRARRIGRNELETEKSALAYHDAQMDYAKVDRDGDGVLEYAQQFLSSDGEYDGLYWPDQPGVEQSPLGPLFGDETPDGEWHGYHYRILTAQGPSAPGGAYDYKLGNNMSRGFALVAWPAKYGDSGVMSIMVSHDGELFEKDLGPGGDKVAQSMTSFDPDSSWAEVKDADVATAP
ncbi:DUF2950 domain-containing protein [Agrilutibacter solisilvae]|uniref:DUF2950 domain-containing protein n=1 Tax=Agrilutibacter solisilvae TaxID=2763317 RepID=A0A975ASQ2_9GAMM|nr:DUF2950 domain-containing protein [Lysobacter solisilvae]QSX79189.1 DUF2950 domain-containing protein [Lysobacter solisilvae]